MLHRINGYVIITLLILSNIGALMIARHAFGGAFETQVLFGVLALLTTGGAGLAYYNIKRLQIDQHRAWMLRTWFYAGIIITMRLIMIIGALILSRTERVYRAMHCDEIAFGYDDAALFESRYPQCMNPVNGTNDGGYVAVQGTFANGDVIEIGTSLGFTSGTAGWLALMLHAIGECSIP